MDEEESVSEGNSSVQEHNSSVPEGNPSGRKRKRKHPKEPVRFSTRTPKWISSFTVDDDKWSLTEKRRLLEALQRYDNDNISQIAKLVGTKSEKEVEEKIRFLSGVDKYRGPNERVDGIGSEKAPIEAWIDLVQEMTKYEHKEYSKFVPKILGLIARNEKFADSGVPNLQWKNIYQFLADITEDKVEPHKLTDMEALVVLDLMHSLGNSLLKSDTTEQRRIMDYKYNLLNFKSDNPKMLEREININRVAQALTNDLWDLESNQEESSNTPGTSASFSSQSNIQGMENSPEDRHTIEISSSMDSIATLTSSCEKLSDCSNVDHALAGTSMSSPQNSEVTVTSDHKYISRQNNKQEGRDSNNDSSKDGSTKTNKRKWNASSGVKLAGGNRFGKKFERPKYFTLNPLCVPTQPLAFRPNMN